MAQRTEVRTFGIVDMGMIIFAATVSPWFAAGLGVLRLLTATKWGAGFVLAGLDSLGCDIPNDRFTRLLIPGAAHHLPHLAPGATDAPRWASLFKRIGEGLFLDHSPRDDYEDDEAAALSLVAVPRQTAYPAPVQRRNGDTQPVRAIAPMAAPSLLTSEEAQQLARGAALLRRPLYDNDATQAWGNTILAAMPRWGKTQVQIARIVEDIAQGHRVVWMSSHLTLYHPADQPTDLHPVAHLFEQIYDYGKILDTLNHLAGPVLKERLDRYRDGKDVGQIIALHIGEWPALVAEHGEKIAVPVRRLLREGPKAGIIISTLDAQDAQVQTLMLGSGLRQNFWNKLLGGVDKYSWDGLADQHESFCKPPTRTWYAAGIGFVRFPLPSAATIAALVGGPVPAPAAAPAPPAAADPWDDWTAQLFASAPAAAEPDLVAGLASLQRRGKLTRETALLLACGDEAAAVRALAALGMAQRDIVRLWGGKTQRTNAHIGALLGNGETDGDE